MYASCVDYEVRRREVGEGDIGGETYCALLYMICFGDELDEWGWGNGLSWVLICCVEYAGVLSMLGYVEYAGVLGE